MLIALSKQITNTIPKYSHKCYSQIQCQMLVLDWYYCNLFIWTPIKNSTVTVKVLKNDKFCKSMLQTLKQYFFNVLLPDVVTRKTGACAGKMQQNYCYCKQSCFEPMIGSDDTDWTIAWFHVACVQIIRAPHDSWFCPDYVSKKKSK